LIDPAAMGQEAESGQNVAEKVIASERAFSRLQNAWRTFGIRNAQGAFEPDAMSLMLQPKIYSAEEFAEILESAVPLPVPEVIRSENGRLDAHLKGVLAKNMIGNDPVRLRSYNGKLVGPTLICKPGDILHITVENVLEPESIHVSGMNRLHSFNTFNLHTHGLHVSPSGISDNILLEIVPGAIQKYRIEIPEDHPAGTFWYHPHHHGSTAATVSSGMSGALIIEGGLDGVPGIKGTEDRILLLNQIPYINNGSKAVFPDIPKDADLKEGVIEENYADYCFGPGTWDQLKRFTTINGAKIPRIRMKAGSVERWRFVGSAMREVVMPELVLHGRNNKGVPSTLKFQEIAVDGLALGRMAERDRLEIWPGYRSDVLVQAPDTPGSFYFLRDARPTLKPIDEERRILAVVEIEGPVKPMPLPESKKLAGLRLPSISPTEVTGRQVVAYGIIPKGNGVEFTVDRAAFDPGESRKVMLGDVDEWTLTSRNNVGPVSHPFHIHVNPFEVFSILDKEGVERLDRDPETGELIPVWRDTIIVHEGWKVSFRTRYEDFDGVFVEHCHILDHEDQGMMELIEIVRPVSGANQALGGAISERAGGSPFTAPEFELPNAKGERQSLSDFKGKPTVLFFFEGFECFRCNVQMAALMEREEKFRSAGIQVLGVSTDTVEGLAIALESTPVSFPLLADPELSAFRSYGCYSNQPLHGLFLLDKAGRVHWQNVSSTPFMEIDAVIDRVKTLDSTLSGK